MKHIRDIGSLQCRGKRYFNLEGGILKVQADVSDVTYSVIERPKGDDFSYNMGRTNAFVDIAEKRKPLLTGKCPPVGSGVLRNLPAMLATLLVTEKRVSKELRQLVWSLGTRSL